MALLQISEPGMMPAPHQRKLAVGIDLGTTNSLVATVRSGLAETLADLHGNILLPSVVFYDKNDILVGEEALQRAAMQPTETIISVKRLIGRSLADIQSRYPQLPYHFTASENGLPLIDTAQGTKNPIQVSSDILAQLAARASDSLSGELEGVVITVPAYFDDAQRQATKDAATLAGLNVLRLLNEPTAAAVAYGLDSGQEGIIAVYDLGGGTFDISILRLSRGVFEVLATGGDSSLGGDDFDHLLANWLAEKMQVVETSSESASLKPSNLVFSKLELSRRQREILEAAVQAKHALTDSENTTVTVAGQSIEITKTEFETLIQPLVQKTLMVCRRSLRDAGLMNEAIKEVVMVGGSTRVPLVREMVGEFFNRTPLTSIDPDRVVAIGAAIQADSLVGNKPDGELLLLDVIPLSLGIETMGGLVEKIIQRNTTIPTSRAQEFTTFKDGQTAMSIHVLQGERELVADCRSLAKFSLKGIPPMAAGGAHIRVTFQVDADGLLSVSAMEKSTGVQSQIQVKPSYGLTEDEIAQMLMASIEHAKDDVTQRLIIEKRVDAQRLIESVEVALEADSALLTTDELTAINHALEAVKIVITTHDNIASAQIDKVVDALSHATEAFAAKRMNQSVQQALKGQSIDKI